MIVIGAVNTEYRAIPNNRPHMEVACYKVNISSVQKLVKGDTKLEEVFDKDENTYKHNEIEGEFYWQYKGIQ